MSVPDKDTIRKALKDAYFEGFNDHLYKSTEYLREYCWNVSMVRECFEKDLEREREK